MQIIKVGLISGNVKGNERAPNMILKTLNEIGSNEKGKMIKLKELNLEEIHVNLDNIAEAEHLIYEGSKEILEKNFFSLFLGGDGGISYSILRAFNKIEKNPLLIVFDAHADCLVERGEGSRVWIRRLIEGGFNPGNIILVSTRNIWKEEVEFLDKNKILIIKMDLLKEDMEGICDLIMERAQDSSGFYISIDIDCLDPAFAPGTSNLEPGGLSSRELIYFIKRLKLLKNLKGADIVEINPTLDFNNMTVKLGAKLIAEMI